MATVSTAETTEPGTRRAILEILKRQDPQDAAGLAAQLGLSAMAVRQHLYALQEQKLVTFAEQAGPVGRPAKLWRLTAEADRFFPDGHAELTLDLIGAMKTAFGAAGLERLLTVRAAEQLEAYRQRIKPRASLQQKLTTLAAIRSEEGYMAEVQADGRDYLLLEHHCPICTAAAACSGLCAAELAVFQGVLGDEATIEREDHILAGARRCAYRVTRRERAKAHGAASKQRRDPRP